MPVMSQFDLCFRPEADYPHKESWCLLEMCERAPASSGSLACRRNPRYNHRVVVARGLLPRATIMVPATQDALSQPSGARKNAI